MNDFEVQKQINQMVEFIKQEAEEKAREISVSAEEEFNIEKLQMVEQEKQRIKKEYERKEQQVSVKKKIERSTQSNQSRIKVLQARDLAMDELLELARQKVMEVSKSPQYKPLLAGLIAQAAKKLQDMKCVVRCRKQDEQVCKEAIQLASEKVKGLSPALDSSQYLPPGPEISKDGKTCVGGVIVLSSTGKTTCDNTLDARVRNTFEALMPEIRNEIFPNNADDALVV
jgi:V-type H+-transporting ATPase subunit E